MKKLIFACGLFFAFAAMNTVSAQAKSSCTKIGSTVSSKAECKAKAKVASESMERSLVDADAATKAQCTAEQKKKCSKTCLKKCTRDKAMAQNEKNISSNVKMVAMKPNGKAEAVRVAKPSAVQAKAKSMEQ